MSSIQLLFDVTPSDPSIPLGLEFWIDDNCLVNTDHVAENMHISHAIDDQEELPHELRVVLKNKLSQHTQVDSNGVITADAVLTISNITFDGINVDKIATNNATYTHDFNGSQPSVQEQFFGPIGCNGTVSLKFTSPVYLWLLSEM